LVRLVRVVRGEMEFQLECEPRFDYARGSHETERVEKGVVFRSKGMHLTLQATVPLELHGQDAQATWAMKAGEIGGFVLESGTGERPSSLNREQVLGMFND